MDFRLTDANKQPRLPDPFSLALTCTNADIADLPRVKFLIHDFVSYFIETLIQAVILGLTIFSLENLSSI